MLTVHQRLEAAYDYLRVQLAEASTVRGILVLLTLGGGWLAKLPPDVTLTLGIVLGQVMKIMLPDDLPKGFHLPAWRNEPDTPKE